MWSIIPPTHLWHEETVIWPLRKRWWCHWWCIAIVGRQRGVGRYLKGGEGRRKEARQCSYLELGRILAQTHQLCIIAQCATLFYNAHGPYQRSQLYTIGTLRIQKTVVLPWAWEDCWSCTGAPTPVAQQWVQITIHMASTKGATAGYYSGRVKMGLGQKFIRCSNCSVFQSQSS